MVKRTSGPSHGCSGDKSEGAKANQDQDVGRRVAEELPARDQYRETGERDEGSTDNTQRSPRRRLKLILKGEMDQLGQGIPNVHEDECEKI